MNAIHMKLFEDLDIGERFPTVVMGVLNISPESFYEGSIYTTQNELRDATEQMIRNGAKILDMGGRSTAPWSKKITIKEEIARLGPALEYICPIIPDSIILSVDTQYEQVAQKAHEIIAKYNKKMILNDVSCLKTDSSLIEFIIRTQIPIIIMASKKVPGDLLEMDDILLEFKNVLKLLDNKGYDTKKIILDPGIGHWVEEKSYKYDLKIINNLKKLKELNQPILVAISRKSFIGEILKTPNPKDRLNGTLSATAIAVYNGANIVRTHDVNRQLSEIIKIAEQLRWQQNQ